MIIIEAKLMITSHLARITEFRKEEEERKKKKGK